MKNPNKIATATVVSAVLAMTVVGPAVLASEVNPNDIGYNNRPHCGGTITYLQHELPYGYSYDHVTSVTEDGIPVPTEAPEAEPMMPETEVGITEDGIEVPHELQTPEAAPMMPEDEVGITEDGIIDVIAPEEFPMMPEDEEGITEDGIAEVVIPEDFPMMPEDATAIAEDGIEAPVVVVEEVAPAVPVFTVAPVEPVITIAPVVAVAPVVPVIAETPVAPVQEANVEAAPVVSEQTPAVVSNEVAPVLPSAPHISSVTPATSKLKDVISHRMLIGRLLRTAVANLHKGSRIDVASVMPGNNYVVEVKNSLFGGSAMADIELISIRTNILGFTTVRYIDLDTNKVCVMRGFKSSFTFFSYKEDIQF